MNGLSSRVASVATSSPPVEPADVRTMPTGCALFPKEMLEWPPRSYAERIYNIQRWTEMPRGGHFGAMEEPELLVEDLRAFVRAIR